MGERAKGIGIAFEIQKISLLVVGEQVVKALPGIACQFSKELQKAARICKIL